MDNKYLWNEMYRPRKVADTILPARLKEIFQAMVDDGNINNMTLVGPAGTGKTTVAKAMCEELGIDYYLINASQNGNIATIRTDVVSFASTMSFQDGLKVVILDEADFLTAEAQAALRGVIEEFHSNCRFIFTGNFANRIIPAIVSRAPIIDFTITKEERKELMVQFIKRVIPVLDERQIDYSKEELVQLITKNFPDYRSTWNLIQRYTTTGKLLIASQIGLTDDILKECVKLLKEKKFSDMRAWVATNLDNDGASLRRALYDKVLPLLKASSRPQLALILAEFDYKEAHVMDKEINAAAMLTTIMAECEFE